MILSELLTTQFNIQVYAVAINTVVKITFCLSQKRRSFRWSIGQISRLVSDWMKENFDPL